MIQRYPTEDGEHIEVRRKIEGTGTNGARGWGSRVRKGDPVDSMNKVGTSRGRGINPLESGNQLIMGTNIL